MKIDKKGKKPGEETTLKGIYMVNYYIFMGSTLLIQIFIDWFIYAGFFLCYSVIGHVFGLLSISIIYLIEQ